MRYRTPPALSAYSYPEHLRASLLAAPAAPGVYIFRAEAGCHPLYIGKSINIRARLQSHCRDRGKSRLLRAASAIEWIRTAGELGALLLEAQLIKTLQPLHNKRLRRIRRLFSLQLQAETVVIEALAGADPAAEHGHLYGLFPSRHAALEALRELADQQGLCYQWLGLEARSARACFRYALGRCRGACLGQDPDHSRRLHHALRAVEIRAWPWAGPVALAERGDDLQAFHIIDRWQYLGTVPSLSMAAQLAGPEPGFDRDGYKILVRPIYSGRHEIIELPALRRADHGLPGPAMRVRQSF